MREIKFRAVVLDEFRWAYGSFVIEPGYYGVNGIPDFNRPVTRYYICDQDGVYQDVCPTTAGQFTGLRDKSGKEIYEGDIIGEKDVWWEPVAFDQACFCIGLEPIGYHFEDEGICLEILGNIYENPELLT